MSLEFQLITEVGHLLLGGPFSGRIDDVFVLNSNDGNSFNGRIYLRHGANLVAFNVSYMEKSSKWNKLWNHQFFKDTQQTSFPLKSYPWLVTNTMLDDGSDGIVIRNEDGIGFYCFDPNKPAVKLQGLSRDTNFRDLYGWGELQSTVLIGRFYRNTRQIGVMSRKKTKSGPIIQFYGAAEDRLQSRKPYPLYTLRKDIDFAIVSKMSMATDFYVADIQRNGQDCIILRKETQLEMYQFDEKYELQQVAKVSLVDSSAGLNERFFFVNLTGQPFRDVIHFTQHGLFAYQQNTANVTEISIKDYSLIHYHAAFSEKNGWMQEYDQSIHMVDANGDGQDDLLFTGPKGLTVLEFDAKEFFWKSLLNPSSLMPVTQRFSHVVGATKAVMVQDGRKESYLLTVDEERKLYLSRLSVKYSSKSPEISGKNQTAPTLVPVSPYRSTAQIPLQVKRTIPVFEKPILRWVDQHSEPMSIMDAVDPVVGSVHFELPIFKAAKFYDPVLSHSFSLSYNSQSAGFSNFVGLGWTFDLPDNYISVDYRNSIFCEEWAFYLTKDSSFFPLKPVATKEHVFIFRQPTLKYDVEFYQKEQRWLIQTEKETFTYGSDGTVQVIRWNLNWPHWRGIGNDVKSLERIPVAWYLIQQRVKATGRIINYRYDIDTIEEKSTRLKYRWTAGIRLKQIESSEIITFDYAPKQQNEYQSLNHLPTNQTDSLLFPVPLRDSHYLMGCQITTDDYKQRLEFVYETDGKGRRLLTAIEQPITANVRESIVQFKYHKAKSEAVEMLLDEIKLPTGLTAHFQYSKINTVVLPDAYSSVSHAIDQQPTIVYSQEYAVMVFRQRQLPDKIQLKILGTNSLETLAELTAIPSKQDGQTFSYDVRAYADFCLLLLKTNKAQKMCLFNRNIHDDKPKWNKDPTCFQFDHGELMQSSEAGVLLHKNRSDVIKILELDKHLAKWNEHQIKLPFNHVLRLEMFNHMVVGYDDRQLFICHPQRSTGQWRINIIEQLNGLINGGSSIIKKFRLPSDNENILIKTLEEDVLQLSSNMIAITSLHLKDNHQLLSKMRLYLLDDHFKVVRRREFNIHGERILELRHRIEHEETGYQLAYQFTNEGFYRLRIVNISGKLVEETRSKIEQDTSRNLNILESEWKKNITIWRDRDFKTYDKANVDQLEEWKKIATGKKQAAINPKNQPKGEQPTCDDVSHAPCNRYCHEMEALSKNKKAKFDDATRIKTNWYECYAKEWKKQWEKNMTIVGEQSIYKPIEKLRHKMALLKAEWKSKGIDISSGEKESQDILATFNAKEDFKKMFDKLFIVNWPRHRVLMTPQGLLTGNGTIIQMMGDDWTLQNQEGNVKIKKNVPFSIILGNSFVLEEVAANHQSQIRNWTLYGQKSEAPAQKIGPPLHQLNISPPDKFINRYPIYLAYQTPNNNTVVVAFADKGEVLGDIRTFSNEQLMIESSSYERLATLARTEKGQPEKMLFLTRSLRSIFSSSVAEKTNAVKRIKMSNNSLQRLTGYEWDTSGKGKVNVTIIPGNDRKLAGWIRQTWTYGDKASDGWTRTASEMFNAGGHSVQKSKETEEYSANSQANDNILWDVNKQKIISDFSPFSLRDQMVSYYGFERYEAKNSNSPTRWRFAESDVVDGGFSLTGSSHLRLKANNKQSTLEGIFIPTEQNINYLASCWIRPSVGAHSLASTVQIDQVTTSFRVIVSANETEVVGLLGRIMRKAGDWLYVEVLIDFDVLRRLYDESLNRLTSDHEKLGTLPKFTIALKVEADLQDGRPVELDVDHIRFTPMTHDFKATVYDLENGQPVSLIGSCGSISRTVYYRGKEMAVIEDVTAVDGRHRLEQVSTFSATGHLFPTPKELPPHFHQQPPCRMVFYPENGGLHETFDAYAWRNRWIIPESESRNATWTVAPGRLLHNHRQSHHFSSADPSVLFGTDSSSAAIRCYYSLLSSDASVTWKLPMGHVQLSRKSTETFSTLTFYGAHNNKSNILTNLPNNGELIVLTEGKRFFIWIDSVLLVDDVILMKSEWTSLIFEAQGNCFIEDCVFMGNPRVEMEYLNEWGEKMQTIQLETDTSVLVSHTLYDALGRPAITTKLTRITSNGQKPLLTYYTDFVSGPIDPSNPLSVWHTHRLHGEVDRLNALDRGVAYFRVEYDASPLNEKVIEGLPGPEFTVDGPFAKKTRTWYSPKDNNIDVVENHFPISRGFRHKVEELANGTKKVAVLDENENRVALYIYVPGYDHLLSTYEYDSKKRLIKILPPIYHSYAKTLMKSGPLLLTTASNSQNLSTDEINWQQKYGTFMSYDDETDRLISKTTPDTGTFNYFYNRAGQIRLEIHSSSEEMDKIDNVVFYEYDVDGGTVTRTGYLEQMPMTREEFQKSLAEGSLINAKSYQLIDRSEVEQRHYDPSLSRGERNATFVMHNSNYNVVEELRWDDRDRLVELKQIVNDRYADWQIRKTYYPHSNRLQSIEYPTANDEPIQLKYHYNKLGQLIELTLDGQRDAVVRFSYHGSGQLASESFHPGSNNEFNRTFLYNSPGFLEKISDPYLTESISYTEEGYGQSGYGDGIVMKTKFNATWAPNADWRWFQIADGSKLGLESNSSAQLCFNALKRNGYMTKTGRPLKDYYYPFSADGQGKDWMPLICGGRNGQQLAKILAQRRMPRIYGHRYAYGHHQELVKAKYFTDETEKLAIPFQPDSLANQTALNRQQSRDIWKKLNEHGFILTDERNSDWLSAVANPAKSLLRSDDLKSGLQAVQDDVTLYQDHLEKMILNEIGQGRNHLMDLKEFHKIFTQWKGMEDGLPFANEERFLQVVEKVHQLLSKTKDNSTWLDPKLKDIFRPAPYSSSLSDFVRMLCRRFSYGLGQHPFDVASYEIDANGNHRKFYTGFRRYEFSYDEKKTNQIRSVRVDEPGQLKTVKGNEMIHDSQGNVIQALHKNIQRIEYNIASKRTTAIHLTDGRTVRFAYDGRGERVLKQVMGKDGQMITEVHYLRDEDGRVLFDRRTTYSPVMASFPELKDAESMAVITAYVYGPRGLVGFLRNGIFYSIWSDHSGSVRLILRDGQVVSAYDYLPYGQLMRAYGSDPASAIAYRYTGQEWDEETGLYNYHARLYDPDIGRFYQPDPRAQYFSPYKYVGNSPLSLGDPDGEIALLTAFLIGLFAVGGAYLGGSAANDNWNPAEWNYKNGATWLGIVGGGIAGGFMPLAAGVSVAAIGLPATIAAATTTAYVSAAASNNEWDPTKWDFDRPGTYNALFQGASTGLSIVSGAGIAHQFASKFGMLGKSLVLTGTYGTAAGMAYGHGVQANDGQLNPFKWDFTNPATLNAMFEGIDVGIGLPTDLTQIGRGIFKLAKRSPKQLAAILPTLNHLKLKQLTPLLAKTAKSPLGKVAVGTLTAYFMTSLTNGNFDPSGWDGSSLSTYEGFLNGLTLGVSARNMLKAGRRRVAGNSGGKGGQRVKLAIEKTNLAVRKVFDDIRPGKIKKWMKTKLFEKLPKLLLASNQFGLQFSTKHLSSKLMIKQPEIQITSKQLAEIETPSNRKRKRQNEVYTDREIGSMGCGMKRRLKRGSGYSKPCEIRLPDPEAQKKLNEDPVGFLKETALSTRLVYETSNRNFPQVVNGGVYQFQLVHASDGAGYSLRTKTSSSNDAMAVEGYWLDTKEKIQINPLGETRFIFTGELQGCTIYVKYDYDKIGNNGGQEPKMTVYHYRRPTPDAIYLKDGRFVTERGTAIPELKGAEQLFDVNGNVLKIEKGEIAPTDSIYRKDDKGNLKLVMEEMVEKNRELKKIEDDLAAEYDIAIRHEDYLGLPANYARNFADNGLGMMWSTPLLFRDTNNQWHFASQKIWYPEIFNQEKFKIYPEMYQQNYDDFRNQVGDRFSFGEYLWQWKNNLKTNGVFTKPLNSIPRSQSEANLIAQRKFSSREEFKDYVMSVKADIVSNGKPAPSTWQDKIEKRVDVRDLDRGGSRRSRRSLWMETKNVTYPFKCQREPNNFDFNGPQPSIDPPQYGTSSGSRPRSWINLLSPSTGRRIIESIVSIRSIDSILQFLTIPRVSNLGETEDNQYAIDLPLQLDKTDYRDVTIGNCFTFSEDETLVCYGHNGQTLLFAHSADSSPLSLEHAEDTFHHCRPIEWYGRPSVTCRGEKTTFIHTPYERTSAAVDLLSAVDGWLLMAYAVPGLYREVGKFFSHVKNSWSRSARASTTIGTECKESWQKQMQEVDELVAKCEIHHVIWALPLIEEIRQQIESLMDKNKVDTMDEARAVKTMTERLTALMEDVGELVGCGAEDEDLFYDCLEECPAEEEPTFKENNNSAESISAGLHHILAKNQW